MIVEGAFQKLPELLETSAGSRQVREATVVHCMATAVLMELNARNIEHPTQHVVVERPFRLQGPGSGFLADLYVGLSGAVPNPEILAGYGYRNECWLEAKAFLRSSVHRSPQRRRSEDVGRIVRDILRVCLFPEESQGAHRQNARYLLLIGGVDPTVFWQGEDFRSWVNALTTAGEQSVHIPVNSLNRTAAKAVCGKDDARSIPEIRLHLSNTTFRPDLSVNKTFSRYWGALSRIMKFRVSTASWSVEFTDHAGTQWGPQQNAELELAREYVAELISTSSG